MKKEPEKNFFSIREVADMLKENEPTLRYWESEFPEVIAPRRYGRGVRAYQESDIENLRLVKYLVRDCGLTLDGARKKLKNNKEEEEKKAKIMHRLCSIKEELKGLGEAMREAERITN